MAVTGTINIGGNELTWTSPTLGALEEFEAQVGLITDMRIVNSVKGRVFLAHLCLKEKQPDITPGVIGCWPAQDWNAVWDMILEAVPIFQTTGAPPVPPAPRPAADAGQGSSSPTSSTAPAPSDGGQAKPGASA